MSTREVVRDYFDRLARKADWEALLGDDFRFTSCTSPVKEVVGKSPFREATKRFYSSIQSFELRDLVVDGAKACAFTRYQLRSPTGTTFSERRGRVVYGQKCPDRSARHLLRYCALPKVTTFLAPLAERPTGEWPTRPPLNRRMQPTCPDGRQPPLGLHLPRALVRKASVRCVLQP